MSQLFPTPSIMPFTNLELSELTLQETEHLETQLHSNSFYLTTATGNHHTLRLNSLDSMRTFSSSSIKVSQMPTTATNNHYLKMLLLPPTSLLLSTLTFKNSQILLRMYLNGSSMTSTALASTFFLSTRMLMVVSNNSLTLQVSLDLLRP